MHMIQYIDGCCDILFERNESKMGEATAEPQIPVLVVCIYITHSQTTSIYNVRGGTTSTSASRSC